MTTLGWLIIWGVVLAVVYVIGSEIAKGRRHRRIRQIMHTYDCSWAEAERTLDQWKFDQLGR